ncbi:MAG: aminoacyl-tRNA hydrolase [Bacilli bacterium]
MKLIVGLGNPGNEYNGTRHNIGFDVIDFLVKKLKITTFNNKFGGLFYKTIINDKKVILLKPQKFMNLSGIVINDFINYYKIDINDILIVHDDLDLEFGKLRLKINSSSGGHNGIKSIENILNTNYCKRLKIGIGNSKLIDSKDYVLSKFKNEEKDEKEFLLNKVYEIITDFLQMDYNSLMNKYN